METGHKNRILIDLEKLNTLGAQGCPAKTHNFPTNSLMAAMYSVIPFRKMSL
jgi:hypothetical protein